MDWISVKDRLPGKHEFVAFTWDGKEINDEYSMDLSTKKWERELSMGWIQESPNPITHWMPWPQPPKEGE